jgi:hypothetical protein
MTPTKEMVAVSWVELVKLAPKLPPLKITLVPGWKLVPMIVRVGEEPVWAVAGLIEVIVGGGGKVTVKFTGADAVAEGIGLTTDSG